MDRKSLIVLSLASVASLLLAGCGGGGETEGPKQTTITTQATVNGLLQNWEANVQGDDTGTTSPPPCDPSTDSYCVLDFAGVTSATSGQFIFYTDDIPANWNIGASDVADDSTCQQGASWSGTLTTTGPIITCGDIGGGSLVVTPSKCNILLSATGTIIVDTCPTTITLTTPVRMSTAHAMAVGTYDDSGNSIASNSITASSSTSITVPTPGFVGNAVVVIVDPTTNQVIGAGLFTTSQTKKT